MKHPSRRTHRRGFTIVELVIVIAVIGILATVLVPTFGDIITKANEAKDIQTVKNMNTALSVYGATMSDEPVGNALIQDIDDVMAALAQAGFDTAKELTPVCKGHSFYWYKTTNQIVYVNEQKNDFDLVYPKGIADFPSAKDDTRLVNIANEAPDASGDEDDTPDQPGNPYAGKVISILGDSISTFEGYIPVADGFNLEHLARFATDYPATGVTDVNETYWMQIIHQLGAKLGINDSWRGAMVSGWKPVTTGLTGTTGEKASFADLTRIQNLGSNGTPDVILFYGGTNDLAHGNSIGTFNPTSAPVQANLETKTVWNNLADAYTETLLRLKHFYPDAKIVAILPAETVDYYKLSLDEGNALMRQICEHYKIPYVDLQGKGVTVSNPGDNIHPNMDGMDRITELVLEVLSQQKDMKPGENVVYSVSHVLENSAASKCYVKGISSGKGFEETISGTDARVTVTMGGKDITNSVYADGKLTISAVTGDLVITVKSTLTWDGHLQARPDGATASTNLWTALKPENLYHTANGWGDGGNKNVWSITVPVEAGEQIYASSFGAGTTNGSGGTNGIRVAFLLASGTVEFKTHDKVYTEFSSKGYITAPENAVAVSIPMWNNTGDWEIYIGKLK